MKQTLGLTKARSLGPLAEAIERAGGSMTRAFRQAELPLRLLDEPEQLILLRDQMRLLESAAREIGDDGLPARLSTQAGARSLGTLGKLVCAQPDLGAAIHCSNAMVANTLQSGTVHVLELRDGRACWTYALSGPERIGRQKNEILCLGYRLDLMRQFLGRDWAPSHVTISGGILDGRRQVADILSCDVALGSVTSLVFPAALLEVPNARATEMPAVTPDPVPDGDRLIQVVEGLIALDLLDGMPTLDGLARRLRSSRRDLQRRLSGFGTSFSTLRQSVMSRRARDLMRDPARSVTEVALDLGYADPAHFTRAFRGWTGLGPRAWRMRTS